GTGNDTVSVLGAAGNDIFTVTQPSSTQLRVVTGITGKAFTVTHTENITVNGQDGNDTITLGSNLSFPKPTHALVFLGGAGNDRLNGSSLAVSHWNVTLSGYAGNDSITGTASDDTLDGGDGNDVINGVPGDGSVSGGNGDDNILGGADKDTLSGDVGNDTIGGQDGDDSIEGGAGSDALNGDAGN